MDKFTALVRNARGDGWRRFDAPVDVVVAESLDQVLPALSRVEAACADGLTAAGYVAYEAAPAFDSSLQAHPSRIPLLLFGLFESSAAAELAPASSLQLPLAPQQGRDDYEKALAQIKEHLRNGDTYQVNYTQHLLGHTEIEPEQLFASLYAAQPSELAAFIQWRELSICSVSPELFFSLENDKITMEPMKGTRPRGKTAEQDQQLHDELLSSEKERAENLMIVDMVRNDLGRIATPGSVKKERLFKIVELPTLWQQVSTISATSKASLTQLFTALFPCASITGAPKASTMKIIKSLEPGPRGVYTGAIGVIRGTQGMRFNVAIRTLTLDSRTQSAEYGIGGGIVWDSEIESEWQETLLKAKVLNPDLQDFSLLETMRFEPGSGIARHTLHVERLLSAAQYFGVPLTRERVESALASLKATAQSASENDDPITGGHNSSQPARIRLLVNHQGEITLQSMPLPAPQAQVTLKLAASPVDTRDKYLQFKTTQRDTYQRLAQAQSDCDDVILWNERGEITETTIYNIYLEIDGELLTPARHCGLLPGTYRQQLLDEGLVREAVLSKDDLRRATRIAVSNSVRGMQDAILIV